MLHSYPVYDSCLVDSGIGSYQVCSVLSFFAKPAFMSASQQKSATELPAGANK